MKITTVFLVLLSTTLLSSCKQYAVSLNERVMYTPASLFTQFRVADRNLQNCLDQTISDLKITRPDELKQLNCSHAGIQSIEGIGIFSSLVALNLANNSITDISAIKDLARLETLILKQNTIRDGASLLNLLHLLELDISENPQFECQITRQLHNNLSSSKPKLVFPAHCSM